MLNVVAVSPSGVTAHAKRTVVLDLVPGTLLIDARTRTATTTARHVPIPEVWRLPRRRFDLALPGLRLRPGRSSAADARPHADVRQPARRAARRRVPAHAGRGADLDGGRVRAGNAITRSLPGPRGPSDRGAGLRPAVHRCEEPHGRDVASAKHGLAVDHVPSLEGVSRRHAGPGWSFTVVLTGQDGFSPTRRAASSRHRRTSSSVCARPAAAGPNCSLRGHGAQGGGRDHAARRRSVHRA